MYRPLILFLLLALVSPATSAPQVKSVVFVTDPADTEIFDATVRLGVGGQPIALDFSKYGAYLDLTFRHPQCQEKRVSIDKINLKERWPDNGCFTLERKNHPFYVYLAPLTLALGLGSWLLYRKGRSVGQLDSPPGDPSDSLVLSNLGKYRLLERLGQGGMATVYKAVSSSDGGEEVAIKVLRQQMAQGDLMNRFRREALLTSRLNHPNILRLIDWGEERGCAFLVLELIAGGTLRERLQDKPVAPTEVWDALAPVCSALIYAHEKGIVHRDLKPENLMITGKGVLKVTDFGLACALDQQRLTATGTTLGTPAYMAPEQIQGDAPHPAMDQYAVGVMAYELLTGRLPFSAPDAVQQIFQTLTQEPPPPSTHAELPAGTDEVILRMLAKSPAARYANIGEAAAELERVLNG